MDEPRAIVRTESLPVILTDDEMRQKGLRAANIVQEMDEVENDKKASADGFKSRTATLSGELKTIANEIRSRTEFRQVEIRDQRDNERMVVETLRVDTGEVIRTREMNADERQEPIPFGKAKAAN